MGGKFHLKLNNGERPIANKYREGKMKRTLKRELKVLEIAKREALSTSAIPRFIAVDLVDCVHELVTLVYVVMTAAGGLGAGRSQDPFGAA